MERKVYLLPTELSDRIRAYQTDQGITSEVEAARRLLDSALQMRDTVKDILIRLKGRFAEEKDFRVLARDGLTNHILVTQISFDEGNRGLAFQFRGGECGRIDADGDLWAGDEPEHLFPIAAPAAYVPRERPKEAAPTRGGSGGPSWDAPKGGDLDDEIPF